MRRGVAMLLIAILVLPSIGGALFASDSDSGLPACCRRDGSHHCAAVASRTASGSGAILRTGKCPAFPAARMGPNNQPAAMPRPSEAIAVASAGQPASQGETQALCRSSYSRAGQKRGPPALPVLQ